MSRVTSLKSFSGFRFKLFYVVLIIVLIIFVYNVEFVKWESYENYEPIPYDIILPRTTHEEQSIFYFNVSTKRKRFLHNDDQKKWMQSRKAMAGELSTLARIMYLEEPLPKPRNTSFKILFYKYGHLVKDRHLMRYSKNYENKYYDPFERCSVRNCEVHFDSPVEKADIVIFHIHETKGLDDLPKRKNLDQIWAFSTDESPYLPFIKTYLKMEHFNGIFNWSMTYRMNADIPVPYGRTLPKETSDFVNPSLKKSSPLAVILGSNCDVQSRRWSYVKELQNHMNVDVVGKCAQTYRRQFQCPGGFKRKCNVIKDYMFYLSFENSKCDEYITEKVWWNAFEQNSIPVVMGGSKKYYEIILPPNSFIHVDDFEYPQDLAKYLIHLNQTGEYVKYYEWKRGFEVLNEHGFFGTPSFHFCRVCEALNYNDLSRKVYNDLGNYWSFKKSCYKPWDSDLIKLDRK